MTGPVPAVALVVCDLGPGTGVGHLMRCLALAEELRERDLEPWFVADASAVPFAAEQLRSRGFSWTAPPEPEALRTLVIRHGAALVVVDSYLLPAWVYADLRRTGAPLLAFVDGEPAGREADVYLNQNLGGEHVPANLADGSTYLGGIDFALMRDEILAPAAAPVRADDRPSVLAFFGGTDVHRAAPVVTELLVGTGVPFTATVVAATPALAEHVRAVPTGPGQDVTAVPPLSRLVDAVRSSDAVISAAGTSTWELMCLGAATALVVVADNQLAGFEAATTSGAALGLGRLTDLPGSGAASRTLRTLLTEPDVRRDLRRRARGLVDGQGRRRVVDAALDRISTRGALHG